VEIMYLKDKVALITGGTRGIGQRIAQAFSQQGAKVFICGREQVPLDLALKNLAGGVEGVVAGTTADVSRYEDCQKLIRVAVEKFGHLDILVNNAGVGHVYKPVDQIAPHIWDTTISTNLSGTFYCCHEAMPFLRKSASGYIFNISSTAALVLLAGGSAYNASKSGLSGFTETLLKDVRYDGIRVSEIVIGSVATEGKYESWKLAVEDVVQLVIDLYKLPARAVVGRVELWPSQPPPNR
jgi:3-oxoacyl-[acyl-carrier protein] reductase